MPRPRGEVEVLEALLTNKANANVENRRGMTPLMAAAEAGSLAGVQVLLDHKANAAATDFTGRTALMWASRKNRSDIVRLLRSRGARE